MVLEVNQTLNFVFVFYSEFPAPKYYKYWNQKLGTRKKKKFLEPNVAIVGYFLVSPILNMQTLQYVIFVF